MLLTSSFSLTKTTSVLLTNWHIINRYDVVIGDSTIFNDEVVEVVFAKMNMLTCLTACHHKQQTVGQELCIGGAKYHNPTTTQTSKGPNGTNPKSKKRRFQLVFGMTKLIESLNRTYQYQISSTLARPQINTSIGPETCLGTLLFKDLISTLAT